MKSASNIRLHPLFDSGIDCVCAACIAIANKTTMANEFKFDWLNDWFYTVKNKMRLKLEIEMLARFLSQYAKQFFSPVENGFKSRKVFVKMDFIAL